MTILLLEKVRGRYIMWIVLLQECVMVVYCVDVYLVQGGQDIFIKATLANREGTRKEEGNIRFDVLQMEDDSSRFLLYEVYSSEDAVKAHKETEHYLVWRKTVAPLMAKPREGVRYRPLSEI